MPDPTIPQAQLEALQDKALQVYQDADSACSTQEDAITAAEQAKETAEADLAGVAPLRESAQAILQSLTLATGSDVTETQADAWDAQLDEIAGQLP